MTKRKHHITPEQQAYRDNIIGKVNKTGLPRKKNRTTWSVDLMPTPTTQDYINNCIFWIKEYEAGRVGIEKALQSSYWLNIQLQKLIAEQNHPSKNNK